MRDGTATVLTIEKMIFLSVTQAYLEKEYRVLQLGVKKMTFWLLAHMLYH